ncbi:Protein CBG21601 [Caenorhabditis briggsae]|uniref:Protein CBG21601 n=1 Tax=Caenorhabditis briggsae TaxID=6238 RepID=A8Y066_CAEBR|nr:Protein CBG21601 [Caenorhabditis briggsae]CAP38356.2 Protein CBG21601 [Caenorhabditis briggsae]
MQMLKEDYIGEKHVKTIRVGLKEEDIYELCQVVREHRSTPFNLTMTVNEGFDFSKVQRLLVEKKNIELVAPIIVDGKPVKISYRLGQLKFELFAKYEFLKGNSPAQASRNLYETKTGGIVENVPREDADDLAREPTSTEIDPELSDYQKPKRATVLDWYCDVSSQDIDKNFKKIADQEYKKNIKYGEIKDDIKPHDCLDLLLMLKLYDAPQRDSLKKAFPMNRVIVTRAYGKVKVQIFKLNDPPLNLQYWRCQNEKCLVWKGYQARFDKTSRFQLQASIHLYYVLHKAKLNVLEFKSEEYESWDPKLDPFFYILKSLNSQFRSDMGSVKANKLIMETRWYGDTGEKNEEQMKDLLKLLNSKHLVSIKLRKWKSVENPREVREAHEETIKIDPLISNMDQWRNAKELDIQNEDIHLNEQDFMNFETVHIILKTEKILDFCERIGAEPKRFSNFESNFGCFVKILTSFKNLSFNFQLHETDFRGHIITFIVDESFDFKAAEDMLAAKFKGSVRYPMPGNRSLELVSENFKIIYHNEEKPKPRIASYSQLVERGMI